MINILINALILILGYSFILKIVTLITLTKGFIIIKIYIM